MRRRRGGGGEGKRRRERGRIKDGGGVVREQRLEEVETGEFIEDKRM